MGCAVVLEFCETRFHMEHYRGCAARRCLGKGCDAHWTKFRGSVLRREYLFGGFPDAFERRASGFLTFLRLLRDRRDAFLCPLSDSRRRPDPIGASPGFSTFSAEVAAPARHKPRNSAGQT